MKVSALHQKKASNLVIYFLWFGVVAPLWYIAINVFVAYRYPGYDAMSQVVSELSAIGAPTRSLWVFLSSIYSAALLVFCWGVWKMSKTSPRLRIVAILLLVSTMIGLFWPPMNRREVLAAGGGGLTDTLHIVFTVAWSVLAFMIMGFAAAALQLRFRLYTIATAVIMIIFGWLTASGAGNLQTGRPTPDMGLWERVNIGVFMIWMFVFALTLLRLQRHETGGEEVASHKYRLNRIREPAA